MNRFIIMTISFLLVYFLKAYTQLFAMFCWIIFLNQHS
jgi:hypothetical protein